MIVGDTFEDEHGTWRVLSVDAEGNPQARALSSASQARLDGAPTGPGYRPTTFDIQKVMLHARLRALEQT